MFGIALAARTSALPGDLAKGQSCEEINTDIAPDFPRPANTHVGWQEQRGPETYWPWGQDGDNGSWIIPAADHIHVRAKICGGALFTSPGRFKALYRVWWEPDTQGGTQTTSTSCEDACQLALQSCMAGAHTGPERGACGKQGQVCVAECGSRRNRPD